MDVFPPLTSYKIFSLSLIFLQFEYDMPSCRFPLVLAMVGVFWTSKICGLVPVVYFRKFLASITSTISLVPFFLLLLVFSLYFVVIPQLLDFLFHFFNLFSLHVLVFEVLTYLQTHWFFPWPCWWTYQRHFSFLLPCF